MIRPLDLLEPEETVGNLWHGWATRASPAPGAARDAGRPRPAPSAAL